jgi:hypothetical protein
MAGRYLKLLLVQYLLVIGVLAHAAVFGVALLEPELAHKVADWVRHVVTAPPTAVSEADWERARASLRRWAPHAASLAHGQIRLDGRPVSSLEQAQTQWRDGSLLEIGPGVYRTPLVVRPSGVRIVGHGRVAFDGAAAEGKGTFVIKGNDTRIENIECRNVAVRDANGACVRLAGRNLVLDHVYFHDSEQGLLTGATPGDVVIRDSFFERLGRGGRAHAIYQGGGTLAIDRSYILGSDGQGHEIKSRARRTTIAHCVVASLTQRDSRLIDLPDGGIVSVQDSTLQQGPNSTHRDMIGFGLEGRRQQQNALEVKRNLIILERRGANRLLGSKVGARGTEIRDNIIVAPQPTEFSADNLEYRSREQAGLPRYPAVPDRP